MEDRGRAAEISAKAVPRLSNPVDRYGRRRAMARLIYARRGVRAQTSTLSTKAGGNHVQDLTPSAASWDSPPSRTTCTHGHGLDTRHQRDGEPVRSPPPASIPLADQAGSEQARRCR
ncbi:hypothetical protein SEVIR_6G225700v4 [Setaria viridis]|uniref:Uncharacterized protein n=1 Tax=Setaria viridis TaxID=4556 RepID=A0A4U6UL23_SETVI|nr:hypothetical protein SEVIR_6G225700v2 [Setaria viridis]